MMKKKREKHLYTLCLIVYSNNPKRFTEHVVNYVWAYYNRVYYNDIMKTTTTKQQ